MQRRYVPQQTEDESKIEFQVQKAIYLPDETAFDTLMTVLPSIDMPVGTGRSKWTTLMFAVHKQRHGMVRKLLEMGADPNCYDHTTRKTCLHLACSLGFGTIVWLLLQTGRIKDINDTKNKDKESPLIAATKRGHKYCVEKLLEYPLHKQVCDINRPGKNNGQTALFIACDKGDIEIVRLLLDYKRMQCNVDCVDNKGYTPLMKAASKNHMDVVKILLEHNANTNLVNVLEQCATLMAVVTKNFSVAKFLFEAAMAKNDHEVLYRKDYKYRTILDQCLKYHIKKEMTQYVRELLWADIHSAWQDINVSKRHSQLPNVPDIIIQYICNMTY